MPLPLGTQSSSDTKPSQLPTPTPSPPGTPPIRPSTLNADTHIEPPTRRPQSLAVSCLGNGDAPLQGSTKLNLNGASSIHDPSSSAHAGNFHPSPDPSLANDASLKDIAKSLPPLDDTNAVPKLSASAIGRQPLLQPSVKIVSPEFSPLTTWSSYPGRGASQLDHDHHSIGDTRGKSEPNRVGGKINIEALETVNEHRVQTSVKQMTAIVDTSRPSLPARTVSTPPLVRRKKSHSKNHEQPRSKGRGSSPAPLNLKDLKPNINGSGSLKPPTPLPDGASSPLSASIPIPPLSIPTYLQLELAADRPSLSRHGPSDVPYESSAVKFERLRNFLLLPPRLEHLLWFGAAACLDAWLYTFTILPLRFGIALSLLARWWVGNAWKEIYDLVEFVYLGVGRLWRRRRRTELKATPTSTGPRSPKSSLPNGSGTRRSSINKIIHAWPDPPLKVSKGVSNFRHRRSRSTPSLLQASHKADLLKGFLVILSSILLLNLDPSRMYHNIRAQAAIKLYMIYNVLEVGSFFSNWC
jgi:hypothetical protein